ncbi:MAG: hypothetical protein LH465_09460 [Sphingomonas bacterium]|nr:hypothetical protein [Sphingomonas bacterium]
MDIIESHQHGLVEQLEIEATSLAGRGRDSPQRAVVYHHLADSLGLANVYALLAAHGALSIDPATAGLQRAVQRSWWRLKRERRAALQERVTRFGEALRALDRQRCAAALLTYRMVATPGLSEQAQRQLDPEITAAYAACRSRRGGANADARRRLFVAQQSWAEALLGDALEQAIVELDWPLDARAVRRAIMTLRIPVSAYHRAEQRGLVHCERRLRRSKAMPELFAANPAQAFFALQRQMAERRRAAAEFTEFSPDEAVRLAA